MTVSTRPEQVGLFSLALMLARTVRSPISADGKRVRTLKSEVELVNASLLFIAHDTRVESFVPVARRTWIKERLP